MVTAIDNYSGTALTKEGEDFERYFEGQFVELTAQSNFSFLQGASHPEEMIHTAQSLGYSGLALCDSDGLYGSVRAYKAAQSPSPFESAETEMIVAKSRARGFRYITGSEILLLNKQSIALIPMNKAGYSRLCRLLTVAKRNTDKYYSRLTLQNLFQHGDDLLVFPYPPWERATLNLLQDEFGDRLFLPVHRDHTWSSHIIGEQAFVLENEGFQLFATQRPLMHETSRKPLHDALTCIRHGKKITDSAGFLTLNRERCLKPLSHLKALWCDRLDLLQKTIDIANLVDFSLSELRYRYPQSDLPDGMTAKDRLQCDCENGLRWRYPGSVPLAAHRLLKKELTIIAELEYEDYFLTLKDICLFADRSGILYQGRGSAANSIVCYTLGLTAIDPLVFSGTFERFLSKERGEPPDIDVDFEHERREEVIQYIYKKYGAERAGMVCTVIRYRSRMALRELCKVFDIPLETVNQLVRYMGKDGLKRLLEDPPSLEKLNLSQKKLQQVMQLTTELIGFPRHIGIHSGGFVIAHESLVDLVPIEKATMQGRYVVQWNKDDIDTLKMMKIDLLSLGMLSALRKCLDLLKVHKGVYMSLASIPADDPKTYEMIQKADTVGVFQIESRAQMSMLPRLKPKNFYDLVIEVAIVRPGPLQGGMVHPFLRRRQGKEPIHYHHPKLKPILQRTMGVPIFQEQVLRMVVAVAGFNPGEADEMRRLLSSSWRKEGHMTQLRQKIIGGMLANGIKKEYAEQIYKTIEGFASYGFPESHSASFAHLTYASSYIKCHFPDVFVCALLNSQPMGFYSAKTLIRDAQHHGVVFQSIDIQKSHYNYLLDRTHVRVGFRAIRGFSRTFGEIIVVERKHGLFKDFSDFIVRVNLPKSALLQLATANAFKSLGLDARQALWHASALDLDRQSLTFAKSPQSFPHDRKSQWIPKESNYQTLTREYQSTGLSLDHHPLQLIRDLLDRQNTFFVKQQWVPYISSRQLLEHNDNDCVRVAGLISVHQRPPTAKGFVFLTLEDEFGLMNVVVKPPIYKKYRNVIQYRALLEIQGVLEFKEGVRNVQALKIFSLRVDDGLNNYFNNSLPASPSVRQL